MPVVTAGTHILLRELEIGDAADLHPVFSDPESTRHTLRIHQSFEETSAWITAIRRGYTSRGFAPWAVVDAESNDLLGYCGIGMARFEGREECEIGYRILRSQWGKGIATEAVRLCLRFASTHLSFPRVVALIQHENIASIRVAEKSGMAYECDTVYEGVNMRLHAIQLIQPRLAPEHYS